MKIGKILKVGILGGLISLSSASCKKASSGYIPAQNIPQGIAKRVELIRWQTHRIVQDSSYKYYGKDTLEITEDIFNGTRAYLNKLNKIAEKKTPDIWTGAKLIRETIIENNGKRNEIQLLKDIYIPRYINQKAVIKSTDVFTHNGENIYVPVEFYGIPNPKLQ